jgi:DNA-binding transcriptional ArsR family regulator
MLDVIDDAEAAAAALDPTRARLLSELAEPASATALAHRVGLSRQKVNYHLRTLEAHGLVEQSGARRHGGLTERLLVATAAAYVISPAALGKAAEAADPACAANRLSARYLIALGARIVREVGALARRADAEGKLLPTLGIDVEVGFRTGDEQVTFADDLTRVVGSLAARYHADDGRRSRLVVGVHPIPDQEDS